ncbi:methyl-accepting chemotaxis protein, partial [Clostridium perfringens]
LKLIQKAQEQNKEFETFFFSYDLTGKNVINFLGETTDVSDRVHYQEAGKGEGKIVVSEPVVSKRTKNNIVTMILPLMKDGKQYGYMGSTLPINAVQESVSSQKYGKSGYAFLVSKAGKFLWHPEK